MKSFVHKNRLIITIDDYIFSIGLANWVIDLLKIKEGTRAHIDAYTIGTKEEWPRICRELKDEKYI